jgi:hypothetical protein
LKTETISSQIEEEKLDDLVSLSRGFKSPENWSNASSDAFLRLEEPG